MCDCALLQSSPKQSGYSCKRVAHPVDVFTTASQHGRVAVSQTSNLQQQGVVKAVLHGAQMGHQVKQGAVSVRLETRFNRSMYNVWTLDEL